MIQNSRFHDRKCEERRCKLGIRRKKGENGTEKFALTVMIGGILVLGNLLKTSA